MENIILHSTPFDKFRELVRDEMRKGFEEHYSSSPKNTQQEGKYWTRKKTAEELNITLPTLRTWTKTGRLKSYEIAGRVLYKPDEVDQALKKQTGSVRK